MRQARPIQRTQQRSSLDPGSAARRIDPYLAQWRQVDHQPIFRHGMVDRS
jgi:hypothetical protein